jgi:hypothetical protein
MFAPKSYREMLTKLNWWTAIATFVYVAVITRVGFLPPIEVDQGLIPPIKDYKDLLSWGSSFGLIALGGAALAFLLSWIFEMHNLVSKALQLRYFWDRYFIVKPLMKASGTNERITREIVRAVINEFYYDWTKRIDQHYVEVFWRYALVFWILFEHLIVVAISIIILALLKTPHLWKLLVYFLGTLTITALQFFFVTVSKTKDQVKQIPAADVRRYFDTRRVIARI